jgi:large subunit ribosomal protein L33
MAKEARVTIRMQCTECKRTNYTTSKNTRKQTERMEMKKFCPGCKKRTVHKETK